jgi:predicted nucleic acid-binding protein
MLYLDASAIVKNYIQEPHTADVRALLADEDTVGTGLLCRAEVAAAFAKAARMQYISLSTAQRALEAFSEDWKTLIRLFPTEELIEQAAQFAMTHDLRGYDAVHLATALAWEQQREKSVTLATFDRQLWNTGNAIGLKVWPQEYP